jgi:putative redox protein
MAKMLINRINDGFAFQAIDEAGNSMRMDIPVDQGGHGTGLRPMQTLLSALGACSGVDIVMILNKQKETIEDFQMEIDGEREANKEPALWKQIHVIFKLKGTMSQEKAEKACALSMDKYCYVAATLRAAGASITWKVEIL